MHRLRGECDLLEGRIENARRPTRTPWPSRDAILKREENLLHREIALLRGEKEWMEWEREREERRSAASTR